MNALKKYLGVVWIALAPAAVYFLVMKAIEKISANPVQQVILPWVIIITVFTPIAIGLMIFGKYCLAGEYDHAE